MIPTLPDSFSFWRPCFGDEASIGRLSLMCKGRGPVNPTGRKDNPRLAGIVPGAITYAR